MNLFFLILILCLCIAAAPIGDGKADDRAAIQYELDHSYRVRLVSGRTYALGDNLHISKRTILESTIPGKPATLHYIGTSRPFGRCHLEIYPEMGPRVTWSEQLSAGVRPTTRPVKGSYAVGYGHPDLPDPEESCYIGFSDSGGLPAPPHDIIGQQHWYAPLLSNPDGTQVSDINFTHSEGNSIDMALYLRYCKGVTLRNISGTFTTALELGPCEGVSVTGLRGTMLPKSHSSSGRAVGIGQGRGISISDVDITAGDAAAIFMMESYSEGVIFQNIRVRLRPDGLPQSGWAPIFFSNGEARSMAVINLRADTENVKGLYLWDSGGLVAEPPRFGLVAHTGEIFTINNVPIKKLVKIPVGN